MGNKKIITLGLNYSQFEGGMTECNRKMKLLDSEFKSASEQTKTFGNETDQLTLKQQQLTEKINLQTQKVKLSHEAYTKALESGKASDKQLDNLKIAYNQNETALARLNNELSENKEKLENTTKSTKSFGDTIRSAASALGIEISPALEAVASKFDGLNENVGTAILTIGAITTALISFTKSTTEAAGEIDELSHKTGLTTDTIQELNYAAEYLEISAGDIGSSIAKMTKNMDTARKGTGDAAEAFKTLGVRIKDSRGNLLDSEEVFYNVIDALGQIGNETEKDALSMAIFGKSAMSLNNLILEGSDGMKKYAKEAHEAGYVMDNETIVAFNEFDDSMVKFNKKLEAVKMTLGQALLPVLDTFASLLSEIPTPVLVGVAVFGALAAIILSVAKAASTMAIANAALSASNVTVGATGAIATVGMGPLLLILLAVAAAIALITGGVAGIKEAMSEVEESTQGIINGVNTATSNTQSAANKSNLVKKQSSLGNYYYGIDYSHSSAGRGFASGTDYYPGGEAWVGEAGPELVRLPRGSRIFSNSESKEMMSGGDTYNITIDAKSVKEFNDVVNIMQTYKRTVRQGALKDG